MTPTDDRAPGRNVHIEACRSPECPCYQAALKAAWGNAEAPLVALRAEVERLQAALDNAVVLAANAAASARAVMGDLEAEVGRLQAIVTDYELTLRAVVSETETHTFGKPRYDATLDHLHDIALASLAASPTPTEEP